ncbi:MAG: acyl dehydratase, partial [Pseudomonadota bacterium]
IASGWHTGSMLMRCLVDGFVSQYSMGSPGIDSVRWPHPVRGGDILRAKVTIASARRSRSKPDRGILVSSSSLFNQNDTLVMEMNSSSFILCRT